MYNPHIFLRDPTQPAHTANICSVVALGADDNSVSIWQTKSARPLIVVKQVFDRQILDLTWSRDGLVLYAASSDGTIGAFQFEAAEMEGIASHSVQEEYLRKFNFEPPPLPTGYSHTIQSAPSTQQSAIEFTPPPPPPPGGVHKLVAKRKKPGNHISSVPSAGQPRVNGTSSAGPRRTPLDTFPPSASHPPRSQAHQQPPLSSSSSFFPTEAEQPFGDPSSRNGWNRDMMDVDIAPITSFDSGKGKGRAAIEESRPIHMRTLGGDRPREVIAPRVLEGGPVSSVSGTANLSIPQLMNVLSCKVQGSEIVLEAKNADGPDGAFVDFMSTSSVPT